MTTHRTPRRAWEGVALALVSGIIATGCGSDSGSGENPGSTSGSTSSTQEAEKGGEPQASKDACDMVSDDVAARVLGVDIVRREPHGKPGDQSVSCIKGLKRSSDPQSFTYVNASVIAGGAAAADSAAGQAGSKPVSGLGDRAVFRSNAGALFVVDGDDLVEVQVVKGGVPGSQKECVTVAKAVLDPRG